jgi:hypothetical protein
MKDFVSRRWITAVALAAWAALACAILGPYGFGWGTLAGFSLMSVLVVVAAMAWLAMRASRSIADVLHDIDAEPVRVSAVALPRKAIR